LNVAVPKRRSLKNTFFATSSYWTIVFKICTVNSGTGIIWFNIEAILAGSGRIAFIIGLDFILAGIVEILSRDERGRLQEKNVLEEGNGENFSPLIFGQQVATHHHRSNASYEEESNHTVKHDDGC
jgi:hypothetical protein